MKRCCATPEKKQESGSTPLCVLVAWMHKFRTKCLMPVSLLLAVMLLRATIPAGYMPVAAGGLLFGLCPEGLSTEIAQILLGDAGHDHSHMNHGDSGDGGHHCPIGHLLLAAAAAAADDAPPAVDVVVTPSPATPVTSFFTSVSRTNYHPRGPPA